MGVGQGRHPGASNTGSGPEECREFGQAQIGREGVPGRGRTQMRVQTLKQCPAPHQGYAGIYWGHGLPLEESHCNLPAGILQPEIVAVLIPRQSAHTVNQGVPFSAGLPTRDSVVTVHCKSI